MMTKKDKAKPESFTPIAYRTVEDRPYALHIKSPSLAKQAFRDECNVNKIMDRYQTTGQVPITTQQAQYLHNSSHTFTEAMQKVTEGNQIFSNLPKEVRGRFNNDPAQFVEFISEPQGLKELQAAGLIEPDPPNLDPPIHPKAPETAQNGAPAPKTASVPAPSQDGKP